MTWLIELNLFLWTSFSRWLKELKSFFLTQRIEPFLFSNVTQRIEMFLLKMSQRIEPLFHVNFFVHDSKNLTFFFQCDSKNWTFYYLTQRIQPFSYLTQCIELFSCLPQRIEPYSKYGSKNWIGFSNVTQRLELFSLLWLTELIFLYDSLNWTFLNMTQGINWFFFLKKWKNWMFFQYFSKNWFFYDSKDWIFFTTQRIEPFFGRLKELNFFSLNMTQRIEPSYATQRIEPFPFLPQKNWAFFLNMTQRIELFSWLTELNFFFHWYDSKNWTLCQKKRLKKSKSS